MMTKTIILTILLIVSIMVQNLESVCISQTVAITNPPPILQGTQPVGADARVAGANIRRKSTKITTTPFNCANPPQDICQHGWINNFYVTCTYFYDDEGCWNGCTCKTSNYDGRVSPGANFKNPLVATTDY